MSAPAPDAIPETGPAAGLTVRALYRMLLRAHGAQGWWPAAGAFEMMVGAVLVQNTAWRNVEPAIARLAGAGLLAPRPLADADRATVEHCVRPSGTYRVKARRLLALAHFVMAAGGLEALGRMPTDALRAALLEVHGIGEETADAILCYAFDRARFVMDAYTRRLCTRTGLAADRAGDAALRELFQAELPHDAKVHGECHALIVAHAKAHCRAKPRCTGCPLAARCDFGSMPG